MNFTNEKGNTVDIDREYKKSKIFGWAVTMLSALGISFCWWTGYREGYFKACKDFRDNMEDQMTDEDA